MTPTELIQGAINGHAQSTAQLAGELIRHDFPMERAYAEVYKVTAELVAAGKIVRHQFADCWMLPAGVQVEEKEGEPAQAKLRAGTSVPKQFRHLVEKRK